MEVQMLSNGALPRRDSCDFLPKSDDAAKKCVQKNTLDESAEVPSFKTESYGLPITFASPRSHEAFLAHMAATIQTKDLGTCRILILCQQNSEAQRVKSEMGMRNINTMLLNEDPQMTPHMVRLWSEGYIQQALIVCDEHLKLFEGIPVELVIHTTLPPVPEFKKRLQDLSKLEKKAEILVFSTTTTGTNEENQSLKAQPKTLNKKKRGKKTRKLVVKPLTMNTEEKPSETASSSSQKTENESVNSPLRRLNLAIKEMFAKPPQLPLNDDYPSSSARPSSSFLQMEERAKEVGSLPGEEVQTEGPGLESPPETPESDGWETPPEAEAVRSENIDSYTRKLEAILRARNPAGININSAPPSSADSLVSINGQSSRGTSEIAPEEERMTRVQFGVLAQSRDLLIPCYDTTGVPELNPLIRDAMRTLGIGNSRARGLQRFAWPHVSSGKSLVAVGPETVGKTWCFLPSLCQRTHEQLLQRTEGHYGPTSIVVCFNQQEGNQILTWIIKLLDALPGLPTPCERVVTLWEKGNAQEVACRLSRTVGILVTTPDMLLQLREWHSAAAPLFDTRSVKCLALDNLSNMLRHMGNTTAKMINWIANLLDFHADGCQLFITTRLWVDTLMRRKLLPLVPDVLILFKDALEASVYGGVSLEIKPTQEGEEIRSLVQLLRGRSLDEERIVVMCQVNTQVIELRHKLAEADLRAEAIFLEEHILPAVTRWRQRSPASVLLVIDKLVEKLKCGPVDLLIHYSPAYSWLRFKFRFSLFYDNYASSAPDRSPGKSIILLRKFELDRIWLLCDFMMWHQLPHPRFWLDVLAESRIEKDKADSELAKLTLCDHLASYGDCTRRSCRFRHVMWKEEVQPPANYPTEGEIRFQVLTCNSPAHIAVRLNDLYPIKAAFLKTPMTGLGKTLQLHYEQEKNRRKHEKPKPGNIVIVKNLKRYERAVITRMDENGRKLHVRLLDSGIDELIYNSSQIFVCDQVYQEEPSQAMEVRLLGIEPESMDRIWSHDVRNVVRHKFFSRLQGGRTKIFTAHVEFVIARTIFVKTVVDDEGHDWRTFVLKRFQVHEEEQAMEKLKQIILGAKTCAKS